MSPLPDSHEPDRSRRSTDRRIKATALFRGAKSSEDVRAAFLAADARWTPLAGDVAALRAKIQSLPPAAES